MPIESCQTKLTRMESKLDESIALNKKILAKLEATPVPPIPPPPTPEPIPPVPPAPPIPPVDKKHILLNCLNWRPDGNPMLTPGVNLPVSEASEFTEFVLPIGADGNLMPQVAASVEQKFVSDIHAAGKKATFSVAGGNNNVFYVTNAVKEKFKLVNNIKAHMDKFGFDGVTLDIEGTNIAPLVMVDFINLLRSLLGKDKIIGCYIQGYQLDTVWSRLDLVKDALDWVSVMYYDSGIFNLATFNSLNARLEAKVGKDKVLGGVSVNYRMSDPTRTGLTVEQFGQCLDAVIAKGYKGMGIWQNTIHTPPYRDLLKLKMPIIL